MKIKDFKCPDCRSKTKQVYSTDRNVFLKCRRGHKKEDRRDYPVFMVGKEEFEDGGSA